MGKRHHQAGQNSAAKRQCFGKAPDRYFVSDAGWMRANGYYQRHANIPNRYDHVDRNYYLEISQHTAVLKRKYVDVWVERYYQIDETRSAKPRTAASGLFRLDGDEQWRAVNGAFPV